MGLPNKCLLKSDSVKKPVFMIYVFFMKNQQQVGSKTNIKIEYSFGKCRSCFISQFYGLVAPWCSGYHYCTTSFH